jgi:hypothetical protein
MEEGDLGATGAGTFMDGAEKVRRSLGHDTLYYVLD